MYKVINVFADLQDDRYLYHVGDTFPHDGRKINDERLKQLSTTANARGVILIEKVEDEKAVKKVEAVDTVDTEKPVKSKRKTKNAE